MKGKELLYIRSTGTQYIDTGYIPNQNTRVVCRAKVPNLSGTNWVFGARQSASAKLFTFAWSTNGCFIAAYNNGSVRFANEWNTEEDILVDFDGNTCSMTTEKGTASTSLSAGSFTCPVSMTLFAGNTNGSVTKGSITVYSFRVYENGELLRDLVPWKHTDGRIGMWDKVSETFFENAGTGVFEFEKIPAQVPSIDHTAMVQGWIVGKRLAAMRGKIPADITDAVLVDGMLHIINANAFLNGIELEVT